MKFVFEVIIHGDEIDAIANISAFLAETLTEEIAKGHITIIA